MLDRKEIACAQNPISMILSIISYNILCSFILHQPC